MTLGNFAYELADLRAEQEREAGIAQAKALVRGIGSIICVDCPEPIPPARRRAAPFADRCIDCQRKFENATRRCN